MRPGMTTTLRSAVAAVLEVPPKLRRLSLVLAEDDEVIAQEPLHRSPRDSDNPWVASCTPSRHSDAMTS